ncbi:hypothetical protein [Bacteroides helcogenes]|uniref:Uncharacterized protein n=1 Tax=Bacteroides helcogenes (strain ATCC 35417 / DSM 20613 / JCM 6297 / CCUG 15421 / P 36-108) TaxID=693979 RepID=E6SV23_BACT6|nr:hypothetical protein [Bacteroides helcogenes]ADV43405.1 hypothetical protein Bache_1400 [Bacteroides helcogenes P 36-108]MDY5238173.1 hypothetical protein [Bacteroides helcogenes]
MEQNKKGICLPANIVVLVALAVLVCIGDLAFGLAEYCQAEELHIDRIVLRSLGILGWGTVEWYLADGLWEYYKKKRETNL